MAFTQQLTLDDFVERISTGLENIGWAEFMSVDKALAGVWGMSESLELDWEPVSGVVPRPGTTSLILAVVVDDHVADLLSEKLGFPVRSRARVRSRDISMMQWAKRTFF